MSNAQISFRVLPGQQINRKFFTGNVTIAQLLPICEFANESIPVHESYQRHLDPLRVKKFSQYILEKTPLSETENQLVKWQVPPIMVALPADEGAWSYDSDTLMLTIGMEFALAVLDGQHRCAGFKHIKQQAIEATESSPVKFQWDLIKQAEVGVTFFDAPTLRDRQAIFSDFNRNAKKTDKSSDLLFDQSDIIADFCRSIVAGTSTKPPLLPFSQYEANSPSPRKGGDKLFTFAQIYQMVKLARPDVSDLQARGYLRKYLTALSVAVEPYRLATDYFTGSDIDDFDKETAITPDYLIHNYCTHLKVVTESFGLLGKMIYQEHRKVDEAALRRAFSNINWEIKDEFFDVIKNPDTGKVKGVKKNKIALAEKLFALYKFEMQNHAD